MYPYIVIALSSYSLLAFCGAMAAILYTFIRKDLYEIEFYDYLKALIVSAVGCLLGSKILYAITQIPDLLSDFSMKALILLIPESGFVFYGGLFGAIRGIWLYTRGNKQLREKLFLLETPAFALFHAFGRVGCFMAGCCTGKDLSSPISLGFVELTQIPVQLFEAVYELLLFFVLHRLTKKYERINTLKVYLLSYAVFRFFIEFLRGDEIRGFFAGISTSQWISMAIVVYVIVDTIIHIRTINKKTSQ